MIITHKINMDLARPWIIPPVSVMQDDKYSRNLELTLTENGTAWAIPDDVDAIVRFIKSDGTGGNYDALPDGDDAYRIDGNVLTIALAPEVCTAPGLVRLAVGLKKGHRQLHTFDMELYVKKNPGLNISSNNYFKIAGAVADAGWAPGMILATDANGNVVVMKNPGDMAVQYVAQPLTEKQQMQARQNMGLYGSFTKVVNWDGDATGKVMAGSFVRISDVPADNILSISGVVGTMTMDGEEYPVSINEQNTGAYRLAYGENTVLGYVATEHDMDVEGMGAAAPEPGLYVNSYTKAFTFTFTEQEVIKVPKKYLPDDLGAVKTVNGVGPDANGNVEVKAGTPTDKQIATAVKDYMEENPVEVTGVVKSVNGIAPDENGNVNVEGGTGGVGADGFSPIATVTQTDTGATISITDKSGTTTATIANGKDGAKGDKGDTGAQGNPGKDGANGEDGVSATHSWNGTTLTITSASGTSSANLKGDKGEKGDTGSEGKAGTSVTVKSVSESTADGGSNVITFSDGKTVTIKNGTKGSTGSKGDKGDKGDKGADGKDYSFDPTVYGLPVLELTGDTSPIAVSKDNKVTLSYVYGDRTGTCTLKGQGATSYKKAQALVNEGKAGKFNYTINFDTAFEAVEGWGVQKKYCLKANWIDHSHSRNVVSAKLWGLIVKSRTTENTNLSSLPNGGAVDGFPIVIMLNGEFHGLYTFNIPKDGWMFGLVEDTTKTQAVVGANDHETATQFKGELAGDESDFELEFVSDETNTAWVTTSLNRLINACIDSWGGDLDTTVAQYLDWDSAIDYLIFIVVIKGTDMVDKNYLLTTFDGTKWCFTAYDMDSTYGLIWDGSGLSRAVSLVNFDGCADTHRVWELIKRFKTNALKARYSELRSNILSETRICQHFENFAWAMPSPVLLEDVKKYPTILGSGVNGIDQICRFVRQRLEACDAWIEALPEQETPVEPETPVEMVNLVPTSIDTDGSIYNGTGYKENVRLSSSGGVSGSAQADTVTTGFMPWQSCGIIRIKGAEFSPDSTKHYYVIFYNADKTMVNSYSKFSDEAFSEGATGAEAVVKRSYDETTGVTTLDTSSATSGTDVGEGIVNATYFRLCAKGKGADLIVTVNQEITA